MTKQELDLEREVNIEYLDAILKAWHSPDRKMRKIFVFILFLGAIAIYFTSSFLFGNTWGYIITIVVVIVGLFCAVQLGISFKTEIWSDGKFAYQACVTMEILIAIKEGTYREYGVHILTTGTGKHHNLYKNFIQMYPEYKCLALQRMSRINIESKDIHS